MRSIDGTSASLTNQPVLEATVRGADHCPPVRSAKRSEKFASRCSIQLRIRPRSDTVMYGCDVTPLAGSMTGCSVIDHACGGAAVGGADVSAGASPLRQAEARRVAATRHAAVRYRIKAPSCRG